MVREWARLRAWRLALRVVFGLPRPLKRLVAVQRHLEKMAEYDLAETAR